MIAAVVTCVEAARGSRCEVYSADALVRVRVRVRERESCAADLAAGTVAGNCYRLVA